MNLNIDLLKRRVTDSPVLQLRLPAELKNLFSQEDESTILHALATAALLPGCIEEICKILPQWLTEITSRWIQHGRSRTLTEDVTILSAFSLILPTSRYLVPRVKSFLLQDPLRSLLHEPSELKSKLSLEELQVLLLSLFRVMSIDIDEFQDVIRPTCLSFFLSHKSASVRYLAIQCLCTVMRFADNMSEKLVQKHIGSGPIMGLWNDKEIDYRILKLLEEKRGMELSRDINSWSSDLDLDDQKFSEEVEASLLSSCSANIGGVLVPRSAQLLRTGTTFVPTKTATRNLRKVASALLGDKPVLVTGVSGTGKTILIQEAARLTNQQQSMVTLHLNEQTDAKSLVGLYTSSSSGDSFVWQPGVMTKAMEEGRWVLIEDIDRAPSEVLGVLKPIIESGCLFLPNRKEHIRPAHGFRILATMKTSLNASQIGSHQSLVANTRLWTVVHSADHEEAEIVQLLEARHPRLKPLLGEIMDAHRKVHGAYLTNQEFRTAQSRIPSLRDLLTWCRRIARRLAGKGEHYPHDLVPEDFKNEIFKDAVDCYAALHASRVIYGEIARILAQSLNISPQTTLHLLSPSAMNFKVTDKQLLIGRSTISKLAEHRRTPEKSSFAMTSYARRTLESVAACVSYSEPLLLVGETGVGKTTAVQQFADMIGQRLTVVNLSQQSESTDLIGGLKPMTSRSIILPLVEQFNTLFDDTFSSKRNVKFQQAISKAVEKQNWQRLINLCSEAVQMAESTLKKSLDANLPSDDNGQLPKRRKLSSRHAALRERWDDFTLKLNQTRTQVERGTNKGHAFAFVEGRLVQAVRKGEWLLLDEINLATADTLDNILGLLKSGDDGAPSLLLTESGAIEQVVAHPDFRVFAAMNPATDTGKKDLVPGIRSRFTEVYVHSEDDEIKDLVLIVESYIGVILSSDKRAAFDLARSYQELNKLNAQHKLADGAGDIPHFSIRTLVRCLLYVREHHHSHGLRRAMYEGFSMSFFTVLSRESEDLVLSLVKSHLLSTARNPKSFLSQQPKIRYNDTDYVAFEHHLVRRGTDIPNTQPHYIRTPSVERNLLNLARAASMRRFPILLQGPTSAGKTSMIEFLAKFSGNMFVRVNNHEHTDLQEYLGSYTTGDDGKLQFREGVLVEALRKGHWIVLDELNLAPSDVLEALNRLLDDNRELLIPETQEVVRPHPNFMLFATQNPAGLYGGRKRLSRAFRNRFLELHFDDIPEDELEVILRERSSIAPSFCTQIVQVYKKLSLQRQATRLFEQRNSFATLRDLFRWAARPMDDRLQLARQGFMLLAERMRDAADRQTVKRTIEETIKVVIDESVLYNISRIPGVVQNSSIVWTPAMARLFVLVSEALKNNEPVLLVGETGCGKTQICQTVSRLLGKDLSIYNAHSNTETGDLIGSQRPIRQRIELATALLENLSQLPHAAFSNGAGDGEDLENLIADFQQMDTSNLEPGVIARTKQSIRAYRSLFEWSDGSLIRSMKAGEHFLLDEISLADDSVLERLNSVLEPSRTILLAEKGPIDNLVVAKHGFQFLATMNPGGEFGKRELSAALRNRLTEIWVPPLSEPSDVLPIIESRLGPQHSIFGPRLLDFALWFQEHMQNTATKAIQLRSLLAWADFLRTIKGLTSELAFAHGGALFYIDSLGANPAGLTHSTDNVDAGRRRCLQKLQSLSPNLDVFASYYMVPELSLTPDQLRVGPFSLTRQLNSTSSSLILSAPTTLKNTMRIIRALQLQRPILLEGDPGVGKTAIVTALAAYVGKSFTRINLSDQTDLMDLFGADTPTEDANLGHFSWRDGPLLKAMQSGGWVLLDEMNLASQSVLEGLNSCLDHRQEVYIAELDKSFFCHPDFTLFAAQNPHQQGGGRKGLPASFVNRFTVVYADPFQKDDIMQICSAQRTDVPAETLKAVVEIVTRVQQTVLLSSSLGLGGPWEFNLRDVNRWLDLCGEYGTALSPAHFFETLVTQRFRSVHARQTMLAVYNEVWSTVSTPTFHHQLSTLSFQVGTSFMTRNSRLQPVASRFCIPAVHLSHAQSVITALNHRWPVLLVGPSGSGKTALIKTMAMLKGCKLIEFSLNADTDTIDLIGGFEQYDPRRDLSTMQALVCEHILDALCHQGLESQLSDPAASKAFYALHRAHEECSSPNINIETIETWASRLCLQIPLFKSLESNIQQLKQDLRNEKPRFVWNDGILLDALHSGAWLIMDNANLCNASVLDRLNSLLEPDGSLTISEHHSSALDERVVRPHPDFRIFLTMDPKFGELSRAMRNRSLELYLGADSSLLSRSAEPKFPSASSISALRQVLAIDVQKNEKLDLSIAPYVNLMSEFDQHLIRSQAHHIFRTEICHKFNAQLDNWTAVSTQPGMVIADYYTKIAQNPDYTIPTSILARQARLPAINDALASLCHHSNDEAELSSRYLLLALRNQALKARLASIRASQIQRNAKDLTLLQHSVIALSQSKQKSQLTLPAFQSLTLIVESCDQWLADFGNSSFTFHGTVVDLAEDMFSLLNKQHLDFPRLQAYFRIINEFVLGNRSDKREISQPLVKAVESLGSRAGLQYGKGFQLMWSNWHPLAASSWEQLAAQASLEELVRQFDDLALTLQTPREELARIRLKLTETYDNIQIDPDPEGMVYKLRQVISNVGQRVRPRKQIVGHFEMSLDWILRLLAVQDTEFHSLELQRLALHSHRSDKFLLDRPGKSPVQELKRLAFFSNFSQKEWSDLLHRSSTEIGFSLLSEISSVKNVFLDSFTQVRDESEQLLKALYLHSNEIRQGPTTSIMKLTLRLFRCIMRSHEAVLTVEAKSFVSDLHIQGLNDLSIGEVFNSNVAEYKYLIPVYMDYFRPALGMLTTDATSQPHKTGLALIGICMGALILLVPDQSFDPAVYPTLVRERYQKRRAQLQALIECAQSFQQIFTGQSNSMLIRMFQHDLASLKDCPDAPCIVRPQHTEMDQIQREFTSIIQNVINSKEILRILSQISIDRVHSTRPLSRTLHVLVHRLSKIHRGYNDVVMPISWLLQSLGLGLDLVQAGNHSSLLTIEDTFLSHCPMIGTEPTQIMSWTMQTTAEQGLDTAGMTQFLKHLVLEKEVGCRDFVDESSKVIEFVSVIDMLYGQWTKRLSKDQAEAEANSRYYTYRGGEDQDAGDDHDEMKTLFPTFDDVNDESEVDGGQDPSSELRYDARRIAIELAVLHRQFFFEESKKSSMRQYVMETLSNWKEAAVSDSQRSIDFHGLLPGIILQLESTLQSITDTSTTTPINIYSDTDIVEVKSIISLVSDIRARFEEIATQWPDHAVPVEVLNFCDALLEFKINEPVAKLLTKTEKLLDIVTQWQSVASREWSVVDLTEALTAKIIHWRRLELLSWSKLLDYERMKVEEDCDAWYFIAYEAVVYNTRAVIAKGGSTASYCLELTKTLEEFLTSSKLGQFIYRLRLLRTLGKTLSAIAAQDPRLVEIVQSLSAIQYHYERYEQNIAQILDDGRAELERNIGEQIKLMTWKDVNVQSLRDSARRSHHKLFKIIKKYRALLGQPMRTFTAPADNSGLVNSAFVLAEPQQHVRDIGAAIHQCSRSLPDWQARPERLTMPMEASMSMRRLYTSKRKPIDLNIFLSEMAHDIHSNAVELRKQTPDILTEENTSLVRHLRERKRRLLADTMKTLTVMGIRRNLGTNELQSQASTSNVLAHSFDVAGFMGTATDKEANSAFHAMLDNMPLARSVAREHSSDLTDGEVSRGCGLLEGVLSMLISQRSSLSKTGMVLRTMSNTIRLMKKLQDTQESDTILLSPQFKARADHYLRRATWLCEVGNVASFILHSDSKYTGRTVSAVVSTIEASCGSIRRILTEVQNEEDCSLPWITTKGYVTLIDSLASSFDQLRDSLLQIVADDSRTTYVLSKVLPWLESFTESHSHTNGSDHLTVSDFDGSCRKLLDSIFVTLQQVALVQDSMPSSTEDPNWLLKSSAGFDRSLQALHLSKISEALTDTISQLQGLIHEDLSIGVSIFKVANPVIEQYFYIAHHLYQTHASTHVRLAQLGVLLSKTFISLMKEGFCTPTEPSDGQNDQNGKLEGGTGLGEGEGAEDISKDIGDDEDLSELAQNNEQKKEDGDMENSKDAVDMDHDDLEGQLGSDDERESGKDDDGNSQTGDSDNGIDEETGSVDELDPSAVDEKMWDDMKKDSEKEEKDMKGDKQKGTRTDDQMAKSDVNESSDEPPQADEAQEENPDNAEDAEDDDNVGHGKPEAENLDPHLEEQEALELPEDLQIGNEGGNDDNISDDAMDEFSDIEKDDNAMSEPGEADLESENREGEAASVDDMDNFADADDNEEQRDEQVRDDEDMQKQEDTEMQDPLTSRDNDVAFDIEEQNGGEFGTANQNDNENQDRQDEHAQGLNDTAEIANEQQTQAGKGSDKEQQGEASLGMAEQGAGREDRSQRKEDEGLRKLADFLDQYHQRQEILTAAEEPRPENQEQEIDMADADFEHMGNDDQASDAQALGTATTEQAQKLDESKAVEGRDADVNHDLPMPEDQEMEDAHAQEETIVERFSRLQAQPRQERSAAVTGNHVDNAQSVNQQSRMVTDEADASTDDTDLMDLTTQGMIPPGQEDIPPLMSTSDATTLWTQCSTRTHVLSLLLTEQLRLILAPTKATKLRGDFRSGKRLNIKRIIPYIASGYKRDKIWMRRSVPSKRNYQVMIAMDDSKSMSESGADLLAFETVAMLSKSLSMLEVGELCVVNFGEEAHIRVAHPFDRPFTTPDSGIQVFRNFSFSQRGTDVRNLVGESIALFQEARLRAGQSNNNQTTDLWQLQLIVSDGHCSDHATIQTLVRRAHEQKIAIVFVIVDAGADSIVDLKEAVFEHVDPADDRSEMRVITRRYLERFPFQYYVVVREVADLPGVLASVLKGWFESVVDVL